MSGGIRGAGGGTDTVLALDAATGAARRERALIRHDGPDSALEILGLRQRGPYVQAGSRGGAACWAGSRNRSDREHVILPAPKLTAITVPWEAPRRGSPPGAGAGNRPYSPKCDSAQK